MFYFTEGTIVSLVDTVAGFTNNIKCLESHFQELLDVHRSRKFTFMLRISTNTREVKGGTCYEGGIYFHTT